MWPYGLLETLVFEISSQGDDVCLRVQTDLDEESVPRFTALLRTLEVGPVKSLTIDLTGCGYLNAGCIGAMVELGSRYTGNFHLRVANRGNVRRILDVCDVLGEATFAEVGGEKAARWSFSRAVVSSPALTGVMRRTKGGKALGI